MVSEGYLAPLQLEATPDTSAQHVEEMKDKPKKPGRGRFILHQQCVGVRELN